MRRHACPSCGRRAYFHNTRCGCGTDLFFDPVADRWVTAAAPCLNRAAIGCNWVAVGRGFCRSCAMSQVVPVLHVERNVELLARAERAKRWVLANIANWGWFTAADTGPRPRFLMLSEDTGGRAAQITMGHLAGEITINVTEADLLTRLQRMQDLGEQYRSMVGHFRHELAHFFFDRLAPRPGFLPAFRDLFGDERADYSAALAAHYDSPRAPGADFITPYATAHAHEDWAETSAHLLHIVDFTDSFVSAGLSMQGVPDDFRPYDETDVERLLAIAAEVAIAVNDINRALDNTDLYPFALTVPVRRKLAFAHHWLRAGVTGARQEDAPLRPQSAGA